MADSPNSDGSHDSRRAREKSQAPKDKLCQYCHQSFTSSSLGRHLDQFLSRKKPDGVHDVEEIRKFRGGITRRTAKGNVKQDSEGSHSTPYTTSPAAHDSPIAAHREDLNATPVGGYRITLNAPNWQSTGVINGLPGTSTASPALENIGSRNGKRSYSSIETAVAKDILNLRGDLGSEKDTARALELALREVLDTIKAARYGSLHLLSKPPAFSDIPSLSIRSAPPPSPFPVDIPSHSFPSLVLHLLPPPPTLLTSPIPFATPTSFPLSSPPNQSHHQLLQSTITSLIEQWESDLLRPSAAVPKASPDISRYPSHLASLAENHRDCALDHLELAYNHFTSLPDHQQHDVWQIELARAFIVEKEKRKDRDEELEAVVVEARQLHGQVETLSRCQWPREMALWPPDRRPLGKRVITAMQRRELKDDATTARVASQDALGETDSSHRNGAYADRNEEEGDSDSHWDYDTLVDKWKKIVREDTMRKRGLTRPTPTALSSIPSTSNHTTTIPSPASSNHSKPAATIPATAPAPTSKRKDHPHHLPPPTLPPNFQPWSKRPKLLNGEECMIGIPVSDGEQPPPPPPPPHPQQHPPGPRHVHSKLDDLVAATDHATAEPRPHAHDRDHDHDHDHDLQTRLKEGAQRKDAHHDRVYEFDADEANGLGQQQQRRRRQFGNGTGAANGMGTGT